LDNCLGDIVFGAYMNTLYPSELWGFFVWGSFLGGVLVVAIADGWWAAYQGELASSLSTNGVHIIVEGAEHHSRVFDAEYSQASISAILNVVDVVRTANALEP